MNDRQTLEGLRVLVTRPAHQAQPLMELIARHGGVPIAYPVLDIVAPPDPGPALRALRNPQRYRCAIFTSANAVHALFRLTSGFRFGENTAILAVGPSTARALGECGVRRIACPGAEASGSEGLLALPELGAERVEGQPVAVLRGAGGRRLLESTLRQRGAVVTSVELYARRPLVQPRGRLSAVRPEAMVATSRDVLAALLRGAEPDECRLLLGLPIALLSARVTDAARELGYGGPLETAFEASDSGLLAALVRLCDRVRQTKIR